MGLSQTFLQSGQKLQECGPFRLRGAALLAHAEPLAGCELEIGHVMSLRGQEGVSEAGLSTALLSAT